MASLSAVFGSVDARAMCVESPLIAASGFFTSCARRAAMPSSARVCSVLSLQTCSRRMAISYASRSFSRVTFCPVWKIIFIVIASEVPRTTRYSTLAKCPSGVSGVVSSPTLVRASRPRVPQPRA